MKNNFLISLLLSSIAASGFASEADGIFSYRIGQIEVYMLVERSGPGNTGILVGVDQAMLNQYIPQDGFSSSTNVFLVKTGAQNILIDTGFGQTIFEKMNSLGVEAQDIDAVLITHLHGDHIGGLQRDGQALFPNARIYLSSPELEHFTRTQPNQGAVAALAPYGDRVITFDPPSLGSALNEIFPGIFPIANYGHTPGHTVFMIENGGSRLIIAGDFLHVAPVQFPVPDISATFDIDQRAAAASRRQLMEYAAQNNVLLAGMHIAYPGIGTVEVQGNGFSFTPVE